MDAYCEFLNHFGIDKEHFFLWGIQATVFPSLSQVAKEWENLKTRLFTNQKVFIRGYGRDAHGTKLYQELSGFLFGNSSVAKDPSNNTAPTKLIERVTGKKKNRDIYNYQVSHIWGHTKNPLMFEAPWNICYTPKIMDPFTGHETMGEWPIEYQKKFLGKAYQMYASFVDEYNQILKDYDIEQKLEVYIASLKGQIEEKEIIQFKKDAYAEFSPIKNIEAT